MNQSRIRSRIITIIINKYLYTGEDHSKYKVLKVLCGQLSFGKLRKTEIRLNLLHQPLQPLRKISARDFHVAASLLYHLSSWLSRCCSATLPSELLTLCGYSDGFLKSIALGVTKRLELFSPPTIGLISKLYIYLNLRIFLKNIFKNI